MSEQKKKEVKVEDLKPAKDAKGGAKGSQTNSGHNMSAGGGTLGAGGGMGGTRGKHNN